MGIGRRANIALGATILAAIGRDRFYMAMQGNGPVARIMRGFAGDSEVERIVTNWKHVRQEGDKDRLTSAAIALYGSEDVGGWGVEQQPWGDMHNPLPDQMRGLILPTLESSIKSGDNVVEIGCSNGDVLAYLAKKHAGVFFTGVDFSVKGAKRYECNNLRFLAGYALDLLESRELDGDVLFGTSTFTVFGPRELDAYAYAIAKAGFRSVVLTDPISRGYSPEKYPGESRHMTFGMWGHDYRPVFAKHGYRTSEFRILDYTKHKKKNLLQHQLVRFDR